MWEPWLYSKSNDLNILRPCWHVSGYIPVLITGRYQSLILRTAQLLSTTKTSSSIHEWKWEWNHSWKLRKFSFSLWQSSPHKHLAKFGYKLFMRYKLYNQPSIFMKTKYKNLAIFYFFVFSLWVWLKPSKSLQFILFLF